MKNRRKQPFRSKFDFAPYQKVLVRDFNGDLWIPALYGVYDKSSQFSYRCVGSAPYKECIPYKGNEVLYNTCNEYICLECIITKVDKEYRCMIEFNNNTIRAVGGSIREIIKNIKFQVKEYSCGQHYDFAFVYNGKALN